MQLGAKWKSELNADMEKLTKKKNIGSTSRRIWETSNIEALEIAFYNVPKLNLDWRWFFWQR